MLNIKIEKFEGPLGLLLQLIERQEMDITEVSLANITDQYIDYVKNSGHIRTEEMADFLVVAAKLLLIKSKALLPYLYPEEKQEIDEFEQQLKMYQEFLRAAKVIEQIISLENFMFAREFNRRNMLAGANIFSPPPKLKAENLAEIFSGLISQIKPLAKLEEKSLAETVRIEDKILAIEQMLLERLKLSFNKVLGDNQSKTEIIVCFLAILELTKQRNIMVEQADLFGEIMINKI